MALLTVVLWMGGTFFLEQPHSSLLNPCFFDPASLRICLPSHQLNKNKGSSIIPELSNSSLYAPTAFMNRGSTWECGAIGVGKLRWYIPTGLSTHVSLLEALILKGVQTLAACIDILLHPGCGLLGCIENWRRKSNKKSKLELWTSLRLCSLFGCMLQNLVKKPFANLSQAASLGAEPTSIRYKDRNGKSRVKGSKTLKRSQQLPQTARVAWV